MKDKYLTVTALTKYIKRKIDTDPHLKNIWLRGEISNFKHHSRGHMYLTLKDDGARLKAVMFAGYNRFLKFRPEDGMNVLIKGEISVYEVQGQYQLYIHQMEPDGIGALYLAFEQLKEKLHKQGLFDPSHKKEIPLYPTRIGVITSPTGAAVRDIITTLKRRYPIVDITVIPVLVQGQNGGNSIKNAIEYANHLGTFDTLIVGRGGGSIEELWSFNEEIVARAIYHSEIPVISAVGHETDTTISDFVADLRAPTPTGAAEIAVPSQIELKTRVQTLKRSLNREIQRQLHDQKETLTRIFQSYAFRYPEQLVKQKEQELDQLVDRLEKLAVHSLKEKENRLQNNYHRLLARHPKAQMEQAQQQLANLTKQQRQVMAQIFEKKQMALTNTIHKLELLNPLEIMKRGFAVPYSSDGNIIKSTKQVNENDRITVNIQDGNLDCQVIGIEGGKQDER